MAELSITDTEKIELLTAQRNVVALERDLHAIANQHRTVQESYTKAGQEYTAIRDRVKNRVGDFDEVTFVIKPSSQVDKQPELPFTEAPIEDTPNK